MKLFLHAITLITVISLTFFSCNKDEKKPNIILIYADDFGIGLLGHEGQKILTTPHLDKLANEGIRFSRAYSNMVCAPARASLITGMHDCHKNTFDLVRGGEYMHATKENVNQIDSAINARLGAVPEDQVFLGEVAQKMGYKTAQFGKLEWGFSTTHNQMIRHGWDYYLGYLDHVRAHGFYPPFLFENGQMVSYEGNTRKDCGESKEPDSPAHYADRWNMEGKEVYSQDIFMNGILNFIDTHKDDPFFIYFPTQIPHGPVAIPEVHPDFANDERLTQIEKEYASMIRLLDDNVGQIMAKLQEHGLDENTVIIFTADNGHEMYYQTEGRAVKPYTNIQTGERFDHFERKFYSDLGGDTFNGNGGRAGLKRSNLEGGINVPLLVRWPNKIEKGTTSERLTPNYDLLATIADITGYSKSFDSDGLSFHQDLIGNGKSQEHDHVIYSSFMGPSLVTNEGWKLRTFLSTSGWERTHKFEDRFELFYLPNDKGETVDLSEQHPEKLEELKKRLIEACDGRIENGLFTYKDKMIRLTPHELEK